MSAPSAPSDMLSIPRVAPRRLFSFQDAWHDGALAFAFGRPLADAPCTSPLLSAWWRRGWRHAAAAARVVEVDDAERRECDPGFDWEGARC